MNLALILGQHGEKIKPKLKNIKDNLDIDCYMTIPNFIDVSMKRDKRYDRVIVISNLADDVGIRDLSKFWKKKCKETEIVFLCKSGVDEELARRVLKTFVSPKVAAMLVSATTLTIFSECILLGIDTITDKYGIEKYLSVESDYGVEFQSPEIEQKPVEQPNPQVKKQQIQPEKKKGLFGKLFGGSKQQPKVQQAVQQKVNVEQQVEQVVEQQVQKEESTQVVNELANVEEPIQEVQTYAEVQEEQDIEEIKQDADYTEMQSANHFFENEVNTSEVSNSANVEFDTISVQNTDTDDSGGTDNDFSQVNEVEKEEISSTIPSLNNTVKFKEEENELELNGVEIDFGDVTFDASSVAPVMSGAMVGVADEVTEEAEVLSGYENQYRDAGFNQQVKFKGVSNTLANIYSRKSHKLIIVTGDRGSGVTVTAFALAKEFAKKVPVLYFDCDIDRHGLLNYIDYEYFRTFDNTMVHGIQYCKNSYNFMNCLVSYDVNIDILTSDYSCDADDESIQTAQDVVAENAHNYSVVIVDCPINKLHLIKDLVFTGKTIVCMESSKRGVMNMLCALEDNQLEMKYKRSICNKGMILATKINKRIKTDNVLRYGDSIFAPSGCDWLHMEYRDFTGNLTTDLLSEIVEG